MRIYNTRILIIVLILSYVFIMIRGEHIGGSLGLLIFFSLFNNPELIFSILPTIGIFTLILTLFIEKRIWLYIISLLLLYPCIIAYAMHQIRERDFVDEITPIISMVPFISLSVFLLFKKVNIEKNY